MPENLVSILAPVYNGSSYLPRFLDSILKQTHSSIELILVDDGSTDNTPQIILDFAPRFFDRGIDFLPQCQNNAGQAAAINHALTLMHGAYFCWPDTDDYLFPESIARRVEFLQERPQFDWVASDGLQFDENDLHNPIERIRPPIPADGDLTDFVLRSQALQSPSPMARTEVCDTLFPDRQIQASRHGQNIQLNIPLGLNVRCGYIPEPLYGRVLRETSHSRTFETSDSKIIENRRRGINDITVNALLRMDSEKRYYASIVLFRHVGEMIALAKKNNDPVAIAKWQHTGWKLIKSNFVLTLKTIKKILLK